MIATERDARVARAAAVLAMILVTSLAAAWVAAQSGAMTAASAVAQMKDAKGQMVGSVNLTETPSGVLLHGSLSGLPPGPHAFHIHEAAKCDPPDFKTAGGHFNPGGMKHGYADPKGPHAGDLPNLFVPADGKIEFDAVAKGVTLASGAGSLLGANGTALVIHQTADDYKTDPAGNAGARIACGVVVKK